MSGTETLMTKRDAMQYLSHLRGDSSMPERTFFNSAPAAKLGWYCAISALGPGF